MCPPVVLYVEDEEYDALFMRRAFAKVCPGDDLDIAKDGQSAIDYLSDLSRPLPDLVLLDLNLPIISGFEVLEWIRASERNRRLTVVIFSSSPRPEDRIKAKALGADDYIQKPSSALDFASVVQDVRRRWFNPRITPEETWVTAPAPSPVDPGRRAEL